MRRRHAILPVFTGHYQDLYISSVQGHGSAGNILLRFFLRTAAQGGLVFFIWTHTPPDVAIVTFERSTKPGIACLTYGILTNQGVRGPLEEYGTTGAHLPYIHLSASEQHTIHGGEEPL